MTASQKDLNVFPLCPVTGKRAKRRVHGVSAAFMATLWRFAGAGDVRHLLPDETQVSLYESECGLYFFHPARDGDEDFYRRFYSSQKVYSLIASEHQGRSEFDFAAQYVSGNANVLDVGCGLGEFGSYVKSAVYHGLDPYAPSQAPGSVIRSSLDEHMRDHAGKYDVVTAFHVVEHTCEPVNFCRKLLDFLRPGGLLIIAVPLHPSPVTEVPNLLLNAPPHHLTWWNEGALRALADALESEVIACRPAPPSDHDSIIRWLHKFSWYKIKTDSEDERYFAHRWRWHLNLAWSYSMARLASRWLPAIRTNESMSIVSVVRRADR